MSTYTRARMATLNELNRRGLLNPTQQAAFQEIRNRSTNQVIGLGETAMSIGSAAIAEPVSGFIGLAGLPFGTEAAANAVNRTQEAMTYQPRTEAGQQTLQGFAKAMEPVANAFEQSSSYLGDKTLEYTGSPVLATAAYSVPTMATELLGLKGANIAGRAGKLGGQYELGDIGRQGINRQRGAVGGVDWRNDFEEYDYSKLITHETPILDFNGEIGRGDVFDGIFALYGDKGNTLTSGSETKHISYIPRKIADSSDLDWETTKNSIKEKYGYLDDEQIDILVENVLEDGSGDYSGGIDFLPIEDDPSFIAWELQNLRGKAALDHGFDAIEMSDENGTSVMIPFGSKARVIDVNNPSAATEIAAVMELMSSEKLSLEDAIAKIDVWEDDALTWLKQNIKPINNKAKQ